jgi:hypothetical protein
MKTPEEEDLRQVREYLAVGSNRSAATTISAEQVKLWMESPSLDVQGVIFDFVMDPERAARIEPPLAFGDYRYFVLRYLSRCMIENPQSGWAATRFDASCELLRWCGIIWSDPSVEKDATEEAKDLLRRLCLDYGSEVRRVAIQGILEHLFENPSVRAFFADWRGDPELRDAYDEANEWQRLGGRTPVAPKGTRNP